MAKTDILNAVILQCMNCKTHEYQDDQYGKNMRVHNMGTSTWNCTVCSNKVKRI